MAYVISDECICCGTCEGECPAGAISEGDGKFEGDDKDVVHKGSGFKGYTFGETEQIQFSRFCPEVRA